MHPLLVTEQSLSQLVKCKEGAYKHTLGRPVPAVLLLSLLCLQTLDTGPLRKGCMGDQKTQGEDDDC